MPDDQRIFLGLGSNIDDRYRNLKKGIQLLDSHPHIWVTDRSHIYQSQALYNSNQNDFYNMVLEIDTNLIPIDLLNAVKTIEKETGRDQESKKNMPRLLDIDILVIGDLIMQSAILHLPHPNIIERKFVLKPWFDLDPEFEIPGNDKSVAELLSETKDKSSVRRVLILDKKGIR